MDGDLRVVPLSYGCLKLPGLKVRELGLKDYTQVLQLMRSFTEERTPETPDEIWVVEHPPTFTLGQSGDSSHILHADNIPVVQSDRGGQVTYHGPGQLVIYVLVDIVRCGVGVRKFVRTLEQSIIDLLKAARVKGERRVGAPGVYVDERKIAALGIRVRRGRCYHGLSLNVDMDLTPFSQIDPCGYPGLEVTQLADLGVDWSMEVVAAKLVEKLSSRFPEGVQAN